MHRNSVTVIGDTVKQ